MKKALIIIGFVILLPVMVWGLLRFKPTDWPPAIKEVSLDIKQPVLTKKALTPDNGFYYLEQLKEVNYNLGDLNDSEQEVLADELDECIYKKVFKSSPRLDKLMRQNQSNIELIYKSAECTNFQASTCLGISDGSDMFSNFISNFDLVLYELRLDISKGHSIATDKLLKLLNVAASYSKGRGVINLSAATFVLEKIYFILWHDLASKKISSEKLIGLSNHILNVEKQLQPLEDGLRFERLVAINVLHKIFDGESDIIPADSMQRFSWNILFGSTKENTSKNIDKLYTRIINLAENPFDEKANNAHCEIESFLNTSSIYSIADDSFGKECAEVIIPMVNFLFLRNSKARLRQTAIFLALEAYKSDTNNYPQTLNELTPYYLKTIPRDPHSNDAKQIQYKLNDDENWKLSTVQGQYPGRETREDGISFISATDFFNNSIIVNSY